MEQEEILIEPEESDDLSPLTKLKEVISEVENDYDYIIIDTPPSYGFLSTSSFCFGKNSL